MPANLVGTYTSPEYDIGSSQTVLTWIEADITVIGSGTTWSSQFPSPTIWQDGGVERTWAQIFQLSEGPSVSMRIKAGVSSGIYTEFVEKAQILSGIVTGRYFQIEMTVTDPNVNINVLVGAYTLKYYT